MWRRFGIASLFPCSNGIGVGATPALPLGKAAASLPPSSGSAWCKQHPISSRYRIPISSPTPAWNHGANPYKNLERIITHISHLGPPPAFVIFTGDLISDDDPQSYRHLKLLTDRLPSPVYFTMGNHDLRWAFRHVVLGEESPGRAVLLCVLTLSAPFRRLDSLVEGEVAGTLDTAQLAGWMTCCGRFTATNGGIYAHPPVATGVDWLDAYAFGNGDDLVDILAKHRQVQRVFFGHVHMPNRSPSEVCSLPACIQCLSVWGYGHRPKGLARLPWLRDRAPL